MTIVWRVAPEAADAERVEELARKEFRPIANMVKVLVREALFARQLAEGKQANDTTKRTNLVAAIRGEPRPT
jgi:hypothetical protein